jgi:SagB-type dehydrogenase family enzyme
METPESPGSRKGDIVKRISFAVMLTAWLGAGTMVTCESARAGEIALDTSPHGGSDEIPLPDPKYDGKVSVERALRERRTVRTYEEGPLTLNEISQLLWAAQGITDASRGLRTAPSAGALYPLEVYLVAGNAEGIKQGAYKYKPQEHRLIKVREGDVRGELDAALGKSDVRKAGAVIVFFAVYERTTAKFGEAGIRYVHMEVGHAAQNVYLQATSLNLGTVVIGAFPDRQIKKILNVPEYEQLLYIMPVGRVSPGGRMKPQRNR